MVTNCKLTLIAAPAQDRAAQESGLPVAHLAYRAGAAPICSGPICPWPPGVVCWRWTARALTAGESPRPSVRRSCVSAPHGDFTGCTAPLKDGLFPCCSGRWPSWGSLWPAGAGPSMCPESYSGASDTARVLIPTGISGGSLEQRLTEAAGRFGPARTVLLLERVAEDFFLPSHRPGSPPQPGRASAETGGARRLRLFLHELCAHYFTYMSGENGAHFVLFDDAGSIRKKRQAAVRLGIGEAFLPYSQAEDLLPALLET